MAAQLGCLTGVARLPNVTIQVVPAIAHGGLLGGFALTEHAAYVETAVAGQVFEDPEIIASLLIRFDTLRNSGPASSPDLDRADNRGMESNWRKSSYSGDNGGECVEVATDRAGLVRDTTDRTGPVAFTAEAWQAFAPQPSVNRSCQGCFPFGRHPFSSHERGRLARLTAVPYGIHLLLITAKAMQAAITQA